MHTKVSPQPKHSLFPELAKVPPPFAFLVVLFLRCELIIFSFCLWEPSVAQVMNLLCDLLGAVQFNPHLTIFHIEAIRGSSPGVMGTRAGDRRTI